MPLAPCNHVPPRWVAALQPGKSLSNVRHGLDGHPPFTRRREDAWQIVRTAIAISLSPTFTQTPTPCARAAMGIRDEMLLFLFMANLANRTDHEFTMTSSSSTLLPDPVKLNPNDGPLTPPHSIPGGDAMETHPRGKSHRF